MRQIFGNLNSQNEFIKEFKNNNIISIIGPSYIGKKTFAFDYINSINNESDNMLVSGDTDELYQFICTYPLFGKYKMVVIDNKIDKNIIKLCEESQKHVKLIFISDDSVNIDFIKCKIRWNKLSAEEFNDYVRSIGSDAVIDLTFGRPGLHHIISENFGLFFDLFECCGKFINSKFNIMSNIVPSVFSNKNDGQIIDLISIICHEVAVNSMKLGNFDSKVNDLLLFSSNIYKYKSINFLNYWKTMCIKYC